MTRPLSPDASRPGPRHVVLIAAACSPHGGSELGVGYRFMLALREHVRLTVVTQPFWKPYLDADRAAHPERYEGVTLEYVGTGVFSGVLRENNAQPLNHFVWCRYARRRVRALLRRDPVDLVHYLTLSVIWVPPFFFRFRGVPLVWGPVGGAERPDRRALRRAPLAFRVRERIRGGVIALARAAYAALPTGDASFARSPETARVLGDGVPVMPETGVPDEVLAEAQSRYRAAPAAPVAPGQPYLLASAGSLTLLKNHRLALQAFAALLARRPEGRYVIVGGGPEQAALCALAQKLGIADRVEIRGAVAHADALALLREANLCLHLSYREGASWTVFESLLSGTPVCAFQIAGLAALVHEHNGVPIPPDRPDPDFIARQIDAYLADPLAPGRVVDSLEQHGWARKGATVADAYAALLAAPR